MGHAKRKQTQSQKQKLTAVTVRRVDRDTPLDDRAVDGILDAVYIYDDGGGDPMVGICNAVVAGIALWATIGAVVFLLI